LSDINYGNLGNAELEAMAMGWCCVGWLKPEVGAMYEGLGEGFPWVNTMPEQLPEVFSLSPAQVVAHGRAVAGAQSRALGPHSRTPL
jgi:hypothetical protein